MKEIKGEANVQPQACSCPTLPSAHQGTPVGCSGAPGHCGIPAVTTKEELLRGCGDWVWKGKIPSPQGETSLSRLADSIWITPPPDPQPQAEVPESSRCGFQLAGVMVFQECQSKTHKQGCLDCRHWFSHSSRDQKSEFKAWAGWFLLRALKEGPGPGSSRWLGDGYLFSPCISTSFL